MTQSRNLTMQNAPLRNDWRHLSPRTFCSWIWCTGNSQFPTCSANGYLSWLTTG